MSIEDAKNELRIKYSEIHSKNCNDKEFDWAVQNRSKAGEPRQLILPTIPFIGEDYFSKDSPRILMYASAENLQYYIKNNSNNYRHLEDENVSWNRHRETYTANQRETCETEKRFFPYVHIRPVNDGGLLCAALIVHYALKGKFDYSPAEFIETLTVANAGKYSIDSETGNIDYIHSYKKMQYSEEFIKVDIATLKPKYVILPKTIHSKIKNTVSAAESVSNLIEIYQIGRVINGKLLKDSKFESSNIDKEFLDTLNEWTSKTTNASVKKNMERYYGHVQCELIRKNLTRFPE